MVQHGVPEGIGPHEGRELELMLAGEKPLAMFSDVVPSSFEWPDELFEPHVSSGDLIKKEFLTETPDGKHNIRYLYYALPDEVWRIEEAHALSLIHFEKFCEEAMESCIQMGHLLGYREEDIQTFVKWAIRGRTTRTQQESV